MKKPKRVVVIDPSKNEVYEAEVTSLKDMRAIVGGLIERAIILENGDELYVNEEGLFDSTLRPFFIDGGINQAFVGTAYIIGSVTPTGDNRAAASKVEEIRKKVRFL